ncbi:nucleolar complex protein 3, partial [Pancytospora philotis]
ARHVSEIARVLRVREHSDVVHLALAKVFKNIVPLYRVRVHSEKVKHRNGELAVSAFDRELVGAYNAYIKELCASSSADSFRCAAELLRALDHFNFADRVVAKVLVGTNLDGPAGVACADALVDRIRHDALGDTVFMILNQCLDHRYSHRVVDALLESAYLRRCVEIRIDKEEKYNRERNERRRAERRVRKQKGFFGKAPTYGKQAQKGEKARLVLQSAAKREEDEQLGRIDDKNYVRTVNALQRLYFTVLRDGHRACFRGTFAGVRAFIKLIRLEFREGLYVLLHEALRQADAAAGLECVATVLAVYGDSGLDLKRVLDHVYALLHPFGSALDADAAAALVPAVRQLFVDTRQPLQRVHAMVQRLCLARAVRRMPALSEMIRMLEVAYDIDFSDCERAAKRTNCSAEEDIDKAEIRPLYEYHLLKRVG